jgi:hypothetical protein
MVAANLDEEVRNILALFDNVEKSEISKIDGQILACALRLVFFAGIEKKEISSIKMSDLQWKDHRLKSIDPGSLGIKENLIHLPDEASEALHTYLGYLRSNRSEPILSDTPLFPEYAGQSGMKKFDRHLNKFSESLGFEQIHKLAVKHHEALFRAGLAGRPTHEQFRMDERSVKAILDENIQPAGRRTTIGDRLDAVLEYLKKIDGSNDQFISFMAGFVKSKNKILDFLLQDKSLDPGISQSLKEKNIEVIRSRGSQTNPDLRLKSPSSEISSRSKILHMVEPKDGQEAIEKLLWLVDYIPIISLSDLQELNIFRDIFFETLSGLALDSETKKHVYIKDVASRKALLDKGEIKDAVDTKQAFNDCFYMDFFRRKIVFTPRVSSEETKLPQSSAPLFEATVIGYKESLAIGEPDKVMISFLKQYGDDDLKPLISYLGHTAKRKPVSADEIAEYIQRVQSTVVFPGIRKLVPYRDVLYYVAEKIGANYGKDQPVDRLETQINLRILENLWAGLGKVTQDALCVLQAHEMNCLLARAFWKVHSGTDLVTDRSVHPIHWTQIMGDEICKELQTWISSQAGLANPYFFAVLQCIANISLLRQPRFSRPHMIYREQMVQLRIGEHRYFDVQRIPIPKQAPSQAPSSDPVLLPMVL